MQKHFLFRQVSEERCIEKYKLKSHEIENKEKDQLYNK